MSGLTKDRIKRDLRPRRLRMARAGGDGTQFPLRVAKVTAVDAKRHVMSLYALTGNGDSYDNVSITHASAGARHFLGAIPEVNDLCVVGYSPSESGSARTPYVVAWLVPGAQAGYDWLMTAPTGEADVALTPAMREALIGSFGRRRHKLRQMESGNILASSAQGSDVLLSESVLLANRRGNELGLRDQDQALWSRSLQRFHAEGGVRHYSGMVQRDATFLPTQAFYGSVEWAGDKQIGSDGKALASADLDDEENVGGVHVSDVFDAGLSMGYTDPRDILRRGLFIDENGMPYDGRVEPSATYGGKPLYRVSVDSTNGVLDAGSDVFTEWRIEVAHTNDGTLPVTEQTDGVDIDRLLASAPGTNMDGSGDANPLNRSPNAAMVSMVLGTAIGNDPIGDRDSYGIPLVASLFDKNGGFAPGIRAAGPTTPITDHAAFLLRVKNPTDPKAPEAFLAITKGGAFRTYFPGSGSKGHEEYYQTGKQSNFGSDKDGQSYVIQADGTISFINTGRGRPSDNVGVQVRSEGGAVTIYGGAATTEGAATPSSDPNLTPAGFGAAVIIESGKSILMAAADTTKISGQLIQLNDADSIQLDANTSVAVNSGDTVSINTKSFAVVTNGKAEYTFGGPKNSLPTNGPLRTTSFTGTPLTGALGGVVDAYEVAFGGRDELFRLGRHLTTLNVGSFNVVSMSTAPVTIGAGSGVHMRTGLPGIGSQLDLDVTGALLKASVGNVTMQATVGQAVIKGALGVSIQSPLQVSLSAPYISVNTPTPFVGGVLTDGCINPLTGRTFLLSGSLGVATFRVG
tara:strand:+ start:660 stop:3059 length:2400 start_codon:yes stop_codon:yes gene_type:complete